MRRVLPALFTVVVFAFVYFANKYGADQTEAGDGQADADQPVAMPANVAGMLISFGVKDKDKTNAVWTGQVTASAGKILAMDVSGGNPKKSSVKGAKFNLKSVVNPDAPKKNNPAALRVTLDSPAQARIKVTTNQGNFDFALNELPDSGLEKSFLENRVTVAREYGV